MTEQQLSDEQAAAIVLVACPRCHARAKVRCVARTEPHRERLEYAALHRRELAKLKAWTEGCAASRRA